MTEQESNMEQGKARPSHGAEPSSTTNTTMTPPSIEHDELSDNTSLDINSIRQHRRSHKRHNHNNLQNTYNTINNNNSTRSMPIVRNSESLHQSLKLDPHTLTFCRYRKRMSITCDDELYMKEADMNHIRLSIGLYKRYPLAQSLLKGAPSREKILKEQGVKQTDHIKGTDGWMKSMSAIEPRAIDNFLVPWAIVTANALVTTLLHMIGGISFDSETFSHWDTVYSLVLKTSLAFLLVFRLNRCAVRFWEVRTMWGNVTRLSRSLVSAILAHCGDHDHDHHQQCYHNPSRHPHRDNAIRYVGAYCIACKHFIRREATIPTAELAGFLTRPEMDHVEQAAHAPLYVASQIRYHLHKALRVTPSTPPGMAHARATHLNYMEKMIDGLIEQISGMERVRSTPLPVVYTTHLRTFLFVYLLFLPYIWVTEWEWATTFLVAFTAFALFGIEGASSEVEIPFRKDRPNHLALDAYCVTILDNIQSLVIQDANVDMKEIQEAEDDDDDDQDDHHHPYDPLLGVSSTTHDYIQRHGNSNSSLQPRGNIPITCSDSNLHQTIRKSNLNLGNSIANSSNGDLCNRNSDPHLSRATRLGDDKRGVKLDDIAKSAS